MFKLLSLSSTGRTLFYIIIVVMAFFSLSSDMVFYPGFFKKYLFISPFAFFALALFSSLSLMLMYSKVKVINISTFLLKINNYFLLPLTLTLSIIFTALEYLHYPNYIFSTFHIHMEYLFYLCILSLCLGISTTDINTLKINRKYLIFGSSFFLVFAGIAVKSWPIGYFSVLIDEDGIFENLQFFFYFGSSIIAFLISAREYKRGKYLPAICFITLSFIMLFIAGEEISWGQRFLRIQSPQLLVRYNEQKEINIHNLNGVNSYQYVYYMFVSFLGFSSWFIVRYLPKKVRPLLELFTPPWYLVGYFLPIFIIYVYIEIFRGTHLEWREFGELLLALGFLIYFLEIRAVKN